MNQITSQKRGAPAAKAAAARRNGLKSKGPVSAEGKRRSSGNSLKLALSCTLKTPLLLPGEDAHLLEAMKHSFGQHLRPNDVMEDTLFQALVRQAWMANRAFQVEHRELYNAVLNPGAGHDVSMRLARGWDQFSYSPAAQSVNRGLALARSQFRRALRSLRA